MPQTNLNNPSAALSCGITFVDKINLFSSDLLKCCLYTKGLQPDRAYFTKLFYSKLIGTTQVLEDFLDFHGAKNSSRWYFYRELTATMRHLSLAGYCQKHINNRLVFYNLPDTKPFEQKGNAVIDFINGSIIGLAPVILEEVQRNFIPLPEEGFDATDFPAIITAEPLEADIDDQAQQEQQRNLVVIASEFLGIAETFDTLDFYKPYTLVQINKVVPAKVNEVEVRRFEMLVHNLQSSFDTYVIYGGLRYADRKLKQLRSHFSIVFHLLQLMGRLLHLYERHLHEAGYKDSYRKVQDKLRGVVDPEKLLDHTINYGLYYVCHYLTTGKELAHGILNDHVARGAIQVGIPVPLGFHSRPSLLVAKIVQHYGGPVELVVGKDRFDASSVLDIQWAGGKIHKEKVTEVIFKGDKRALGDLQILAAANYGEDAMGKGVPLPKELDYLK